MALLFTCKNFEKYLTCSSSPEYNFVGQILEECHENPKKNECSAIPLILLHITTMKKMVPLF
jgi:hypothetical protein